MKRSFKENLGFRFQKVQTYEPNQYAFYDRLTKESYIFDNEEEAIAKQDQLRKLQEEGKGV